VLDLSKIEAGKMELDPETFELTTMINDVSSMVQPLVEKNHNKLDIKLPRAIGTIYADKIRVRQMLFNLLSNASKFTKNGNIIISADRVQTGSQDFLEISVADTGIGIHPDKLTKLFKPFTQVDESFTRKYGGTGLGLTICKRYCEMMGGEISVESIPGKGSTFTIRLPAITQAADNQPAASANPG
jgi:signal transduction histidine kinase